jgi:hypothetical protein
MAGDGDKVKDCEILASLVQWYLQWKYDKDYDNAGMIIINN